jgi:hypothetical protein
VGPHDLAAEERMGDLELDTRDLEECGRSLRHVQQELQHAQAVADNYAATIGHPRLADRLRDFAGNWDDTREEMLESIKGLGDAAKGIADAFEDIEAHLVAALEGKK